MTPSCHGDWQPRLTLIVIGHHVIPAEPPHFLGSRPGQQGHYDVGMHLRPVVSGQDLLRLLQR